MTRKERKALRNRMSWLRRARRSPAVWLQIPAVAGFLAFLWWEIPLAVRSVPARRPAPPPQTRVSFVELPSELADRLLRSARTFWSTDRAKEGGAAFDIARLELDGPLPPHRLFSGGGDYPGAWRPAPVGRLPSVLPAATPRGAADASGEDAPLPPMPQGVHSEMDADLAAAGFTYPSPAPDSFVAASGEARFRVEADTNGEVETVLLFPPRTPDAIALEGALRRGRASRRCRGDLTVRWNARRAP